MKALCFCLVRTRIDCPTYKLTSETLELHLGKQRQKFRLKRASMAKLKRLAKLATPCRRKQARLECKA